MLRQWRDIVFNIWSTRVIMWDVRHESTTQYHSPVLPSVLLEKPLTNFPPCLSDTRKNRNFNFIFIFFAIPIQILAVDESLKSLTLCVSRIYILNNIFSFDIFSCFKHVNIKPVNTHPRPLIYRVIEKDHHRGGGHRRRDVSRCVYLVHEVWPRDPLSSCHSVRDRLPWVWHALWFS